jgi:uncharacterized protein
VASRGRHAPAFVTRLNFFPEKPIQMTRLDRFSVIALFTASSLAVPAIARSQGASSTPVIANSVDTVAPATVHESDYAIASGALKLPGTLTLPANARGRLPVVLIVAGSGPTDRNGNTIIPGNPGRLPRSNSYAQLAWGLAQQGIASVRYDKRGLGVNAPKLDMANTGIGDFMDDVTAGAKQLAADPRFSRVILVGHSEGAELVLQAVNRGAPAAGIVMASGAGRRLLPILHEQLSRQLDSATLLQFDSAMAGFLRGETPTANLPPALMPLLLPINRKFMQGMQDYVPTEEIARVRLPVLIVQGGRDIQVTEVDARALAAAQPAAKLLMFPTANHMLKVATGTDLISQMSLYMDPSTPIVPDVVSAIAEWIKALK